MTLRTRSTSRQWTVWLCVALALLAVYVVLSRILFSSVTWNLFDPRLHRLAIPLVVFLFYVAWNTRWDGVRRVKKAKEKTKNVLAKTPSWCDETPHLCGGGVLASQDEQGFASTSKVQGEAEKVEKADGQWNLTSCAAKPPTSGEDAASPLVVQPNGEETSSSLQRKNESGAKRNIPCPPPPLLTSSSDGEVLFAQARALPHKVVPRFDTDGPYLDLLGKAAVVGYAPALAKLGEYAMRRAAWVEAYYWMKQAQRNGMHGLSPTFRTIRKNWSQNGFPDQLSNVNQLFTAEAGSIGRALLHVDSGHEAAKAKEFLKANHPEFMS